jgi:hypothetical protein
MTFWNSASLHSGILHGPAFDHDFGLPYTDAYAVGKFTGSISMNLRPAISGPQFVGFSSAPDADGTGARLVYGVWPGGSTTENCENFQKSNFSLRFNESTDGIQQISSKFGKIDPRPIRKFGGETGYPSDYSAGIPISVSTPQSNVSPYLLFPEDELVLGIDAGVSPAAYSSNFSHITGSFLRIKNKTCKITLYGSMIKDGSEHLHSLNQDLSSDSIHEIVGAEPVLDQFQIEPASSYYGSYLDDVVTGSMLTPLFDGLAFITQDQDNSRRVISRVSLGQAGITGSLQRFSAVNDTNELVYDSCLPDYFDALDLNAEDSEYNYRGDSIIRYDADSDNIYETGLSFASSIKQFPFEGNPTRRIQKTAALVSVADAGANDMMSDPVDITGKTLDDLRTVFLTRYAFLSNAPGILLPDYTEIFSPVSLNLSDNISSNLVSSYFFTGSDDAVLFDLSGMGNDLSLNPNFGGGAHPLPFESAEVPVRNLLNDKSLTFQPVSSPSQVRLAADTTGISDHQMTDMTNDVPFTISTTFRTISTNEQILVERANRDGGVIYEPDYRLFISGTDHKIEFRIFDSTNPTHYKGVKASGIISTIDTNTWYNVTVTYNGDKSETSGVNCMKIYINGTERAVYESSNSPSASRMYTDSGSRLWIGAGGGSSTMEPLDTNEFNGYIHSTHIWKNRELTSSEVTNLSQAELRGVSNGYIKHRSTFGLKNYSGPLRVGTYRYGISSINHEYSSIRISPFHFGHIRDIFEQRRDATFTGNSSPIMCRFVSGSTKIDPSLTFSQNLSSFATSSMPYFDDGMARNRNDNPDTFMSII